MSLRKREDDRPIRKTPDAESSGVIAISRHEKSSSRHRHSSSTEHKSEHRHHSDEADRKSRASRKLARLKDALPEDVAEFEKNIDRLSNTASVSDKDHLHEYVHMFRNLQDIIRVYEASILHSSTPNSRDVYALSTLYSQQREVIADIRTMSDLSGQLELLSRDMLTPLVQGIVQHLTDGYYAIRRLMTETCNAKDTQFALGKLDDILKDLGRGINVERGQAQQKISDILLGPAETAQYSKKSKRKR